MTDAQQQSDYTPEQIEIARMDEENSLQAATLQFLQNRVVLLNLEVRKRDKDIAELQQALSELRVQQTVNERWPEAEERRRETPEVVHAEVKEPPADTDM